jgi:hypothetical protein
VSRADRFNEHLAVRATKAFGTMWAFYVFTAYGLLPLLFPQAINTLLYWSNVVQLVALPLLAVGQAVLGRAAERQAKETHDAVLEELQLLRAQRADAAAPTDTTPDTEETS